MNWMRPEGVAARLRAVSGASEQAATRVPAATRAPEGLAARVRAAVGALEGAAAWGPAACTLPLPQRPLRVAEFDRLFAVALREVARPQRALLRLTLDGSEGVAAATRELIARETTCCSFFDFTLTGTADQLLLLEVRVPEAQIGVLDGLQARAAAMGGGTA
jgi:hypothetical protein